MIRLGFFIHFNRTWLGGINVILSLINSILKNKKHYSKIQIVLVTNSKNKLRNYFKNKNVEVIEDENYFNKNIIFRIIDKISLVLTGKTIFLENFLVKNKLKYISHSPTVTGLNSFTKSIIWIPDFQYLYFPKLFSFKYRILKKLNIKIYKKHAYKILLSSLDAKKDLKKICKIPNKKILVNQFTFDVPNVSKLKKFSYLKKKYDLQKKFFYLPNQYWIHKNHKVVIDTLTKLKKNNKIKNIFIYSTGSKYDYRRPNHFQNLMGLIKKNSLENNYKYLGTVPYIDVMSLMYYSLAVLNPSYFEGWSSTVEQAVAFKKKIILSNIRVHIEQSPQNAIFFKPNNSSDLSKILLNVYKGLKTKRDNIFSKTKQKTTKLKTKKYEEKYMKIIY